MSNPASSFDVVISAEERGEGLGWWRAYLSTPSNNILFTTNAQPWPHDMHIESSVNSKCPTGDNFTFRDDFVREKRDTSGKVREHNQSGGCHYLCKSIDHLCETVHKSYTCHCAHVLQRCRKFKTAHDGAA